MPFLPLPTRPCSGGGGGGGSAATMEPAGLEQILKELLLPDTERIRRVWAGLTGLGGWGGCGKGPLLTPQPSIRLRSSFRPPFGTLLPCLHSATCWHQRPTLRRVTCPFLPKF